MFGYCQRLSVSYATLNSFDVTSNKPAI